MDFLSSLRRAMPGSFEDDGFLEQEEPLPPLHAAVDAEDVDLLRQLAGTADPVDLAAALCRSCEYGKITSTHALLESGRCDANTPVDGDTPLFLAAKRVHLAIVKFLLQHGADVTIKSKNKRSGDKPPAFTPLHGVVDSLAPYQKVEVLPRYEELMQVLLDAGCDINAQDAHGHTALLLSVHKEIVLAPFLLQHGADPNIAENRGGTSMHFLHHPLDHPELFKGLMASGGRLDIIRDGDGQTPLHAYASKCQLGDLSLFLPFVSDWMITDGKGNTLLHTTAAKHRCGSNTVVELLKLGIDPNQRNHKGQQAIHLVEGLEQNIQDVLDILCAAGADLEARDYRGCTLLTKAMRGNPQWNCRELLPYLVSRGANINAQDYKGNGVLSYLIEPYHFRPEYLEFLLSLGADPNMVNYEGDTLLHHLAANFATIDQDTVLLAMIKLVKMGYSPTMPNFRGQTPLHMLCSLSSDNLFAATAQGGKCAIDLLLDVGLGVAINMSDHQGIRPIHLAATISEHLVGKLLARGADATFSTKDGRNMLHIASSARQSNSVGSILDHCDTKKKLAIMLNARSEDGRTPLHVACRSGRLETVNLLLAYGADVNTEDKENRTPLDACAESIAEDQLWHGADDQENIMNTYSAAGVLVEDTHRPKQPTSTMETKHHNTKGLGWKGEITSESSTIGIGRIVRALASHGALAYEKKFGVGPMYYAVEEGNEEMVVELDRLSREMSLQIQGHHPSMTEYYLLRSQHLPDLLQEGFKEYVSEHNVLPMILLGNHEEVAQAVEKIASVIEDRSCMSAVMTSLARWGFSELFRRIGSTMSGNWINDDVTNSRGQKLTPPLLTAAQRALPNLDVIRVMVEKFNPDLNIRFEEDMVDKPRISYQTRMALNRHYKPGDTILHQLAHGTHWWYEGAIRYLLEHGADPNAQNKQGKTPLCNAVSRGELGGHCQLEITRILLEGGADPNIAATCGYTPLAMSAHDTQLFQLLIDYGAYPSQDHPMELFAALSSFNKDVASDLLEMDLDCNTTVLSNAQPHWHTHRVQKVPATRGVKLSPLLYISLLPFNEANCHDHACKMIEFLLERGADPFLPCDKDQVILHEIFASGGIIQPWLDMPDLDIERRDPTGRTLLLAAANSTTGTYSYACTLTAYPLRDGNIAPVSWKEGDPTRAMTLYECGADLSAVDDEGNNVLHYLADFDCSNDHFASIEVRRTLKLFVDKAPELVNQTNVHEQTPWSIAAEKHFVEFMEILRTNNVRAE